jgi:hypothetical protein
MNYNNSSELFLSDPYNLFKEYFFVPGQNVSMENNLNRITRFVILICIIIAFIRKSVDPLYFGLFLIFFIFLLYFIVPNKGMSEQFGNHNFSYGQNGGFGTQPQFPGYNPVYPQLAVGSGVQGSQNPNVVAPQYRIFPQPGFAPMLYANNPANQWALPGPNSAIANLRNIPQPPVQQFLNQTQPYPRTFPNLRQPTNNNVFMNVPVTAFDSPSLYTDYDRYESTAYPTPKTESVKNKVETDFVKGMFVDPAGKLFERNNSQRQFYSVPVGDNYANQTEFSQWLWGSTANCKAGSVNSRYGMKYDENSLLCNGFNRGGSMTNFGRLKAD